MKCQFCDHLKTRVLDSRPGKDHNHIMDPKRDWPSPGAKAYFHSTAAWVWSKQSPLRIRHRLRSVLPFGRKSNQDSGMLPNALIPGDQQRYTDEENRMMLQRTYADPSGSSSLLAV